MEWSIQCTLRERGQKVSSEMMTTFVCPQLLAVDFTCRFHKRPKPSVSSFVDVKVRSEWRAITRSTHRKHSDVSCERRARRAMEEPLTPRGRSAPAEIPAASDDLVRTARGLHRPAHADPVDGRSPQAALSNLEILSQITKKR